VRGRGPSLLLLAIVASLVVAAPASARDSDAPPGAADTWLPSEQWVLEAWLPYDEADLFRALGVNRRELGVLTAGDRTIASVARTRGWPDAGRLAARLVADWADGLPAAQVRELRARALRSLTQAHLGRHLLLHTFHRKSIRENAFTIFGVPIEVYSQQRDLQRTPFQIAAGAGRSRGSVRSALLATLRTTGARGVAQGWMPRAQSRCWLRRLTKGANRWLGLPRAGRKGPKKPARG
jgi:hypothetical protein